MASSNLPYRHELTSAASSYIEMDEEITSYVRERYDNQVQTKVEFRNDRWCVWASIRFTKEELDEMVLELRSRTTAYLAA
ncbi:hypothetical protein BO85DRAFT_488334 [Aspergillus piperis CBS 112811]|uniref:Uncharacterized protein n=2 Tax=Aspergillus subgen. Circumdati TaxID=2720871 RepID=A0A8G1R327_9EURO|nr:hypothetical protein BO87DRAFT_426020 [Aspergillus neoniger CBS 115656]XP_025515534.1 hypothetical protein BO85DRAFT_488334 [Aspergillus piperis CBS 112811]PYH34246.1 hypothetical protein BO87DRAFT_426020 [Aspergillus neoniger CBS 115656]RAH57612.1 hypothetical protein BO85DRAFT_488334 [Aspergillus piperis CBS 112811]